MEWRFLRGEERGEVRFVSPWLCRWVWGVVVGEVVRCGSCMYMMKCLVRHPFAVERFAVVLWYLGLY
jgi:hypothetical protein